MASIACAASALLTVADIWACGVGANKFDSQATAEGLAASTGACVCG